jgi:hypothetical protein
VETSSSARHQTQHGIKLSTTTAVVRRIDQRACALKIDPPTVRHNSKIGFFTKTFQKKKSNSVNSKTI